MEFSSANRIVHRRGWRSFITGPPSLPVMAMLALLAFPNADAIACVNNAECADDGSICTDEVCNPLSPGADAFGCTHPNPAAPAPICPTAYSGLATVIGMDVGNIIDLVLVEAGPLPVAGGAGESYLVDANLSEPGITLSTQALHALTIGQGNAVNTSATVADLVATVAGVGISADVLSSQSAALCSNGVASITGSSVVTNLIVADQSVTASGQPNETISIQVATLTITIILNEQTGSASGGTSDITVNAVHITIDDAVLGPLADIVISSSHSDIVCGIAESCTVDADCVDDGNVCTDEVCNVGGPGADAFGCTHPNNAAPCDDGVFCNGVDTCVAGSCDNAGDPCLGGGICGDTCNEVDDNCFDAAGTTCRADAGECDVAEVCTGASADCPADGFEPINVPCATDGNACTTDACDGSGTCGHTSNAGACDDGLFCNGVETCSPATGCEAGAAPNCADAVACTIDSCNELTDGCDSAPNDALCADANVCTDNTCSPTGCVSVNNTASCDDQNACTTNDQCLDGVCAGSSALCGNGVVDAACGEQCDSPMAEICNNGVDDNGNALIDCADLDCAEVLTSGCDDVCQFTPACIAILGDPAIIRVQLDSPEESVSDGKPTFGFHGRIIPTTPMDPLTDGFVVLISNEEGEIYRAEVAPSDLELRGRNRYGLKREAAAAALRDGGIGKLAIRARRDGGESGFGIRLRSYGDVSRATLPRMTTQVYFGDDVAYLTATWSRRPGRWTLRLSQYDQ